jgi:hypothetical protein
VELKRQSIVVKFSNFHADMEQEVWLCCTNHKRRIFSAAAILRHLFKKEQKHECSFSF